MALDWDRIIIIDEENVVEGEEESVMIFASGIPGHSATIDEVTAVTLPAGSDATVENLGNNENARLRFGIPRGEKGDPGSEWGGIGGDIENQTDLAEALAEKVYKTNVTQYVESSTTATRDYSVGDYIYINNFLFRVTAPISTGDTINPLINAEMVKIGTELKRKADTDDVYTKEEADYQLDDKLDARDTELSGSIVTFEAENDHAIKNLTVGIEPVQDLHGYDNPWPAGGGKNILAKPISYIGDVPNTLDECFFIKAGTYTVSVGSITGATSWRFGIRMKDSSGNDLSDAVYKPNQFSTWNTTNHCWLGGSNTTSLSLTITIATDCYIRIVLAIGDVSSSTVANNAQLESGSTATSFAPYENICPISGWTGCNVQRTGKNLVNYDQWKTVSVVKGTAVWENNGVTLTATSNDCYTSYNLTRFRIPVVEGKTYILSWEETTNASGSIYIFNQEKLTQLVAVNNSNAKELSWTIPAGVKYITYRFGVTNSGTTISYKNIMIRESTTSDEYESSQYTTLPISWETEAGTVYGGSLDILSGMLTVDRVMVDLGTLSWVHFSPSGQIIYDYFKTTISDIKYYSANVLAPYKCSQYKTTTAIQIGKERFDKCIAQSGKIVFISDSAYTDDSDFKTAMNGVQLVYELATPITVLLTPSQMMQTLQGENNIWADTGDSTVTLRLSTGDLAYQDTVDYETQVMNKPDSAPVITETASGSIVSFTDGSTLPVTALSVGIEPVQEGTGDPSPENIRPIYGWAGTRIFKTRKNLLNPANWNATRVTVDENGVYTFTTSGYNADIYSGRNGSQPIQSDVIPKLPFLQPGTYTWSYKYGSGSDINTVRDVKLDGTYSVISSTFVTDGDYRYKIFTIDKPTRISLARGNNINPSVFSEPQLELGSQRTAYEPYVGDVLSVDFPVSEIAPDGIYYGGMVDVLAGTMTVNSNLFTFDGSDDEGWEYVPEYSEPENNIYGYKIESYFPKNDYAGITSKTNLFPYNSNQSGSAPLNTYGLRNYSRRIVVSVSIDNLQDFKTFLGTNNLQLLVYYYKKPVDTVQLTPAQMQTLLGENHIWADTGNTSVTYRADTKLFIQEQIAESETMTRKMIADSATAAGKAQQSLDTGDLIIVGNELRKTTKSIGRGSTITDQNSTVANLADVVKALQQ